MWDYRPTPDDWSIHEILIHITDSEANSFIRARRLIAEPGENLMAYDEMEWARKLDYPHQSVEDALELFRWLRGNTHKLISALPEGTWANSSFHPQNGPTTLDDWLDTYTRHVPDHIAQMERVWEAWQKSQD